MKEISYALNSYRIARETLKKKNVIRHEKPVHCELAEWIAETHLNGRRAESGNQKGWDIELYETDTRVQVKSSAKAKTNKSNWTTLSKHSEGVDELFIVIFDEDLYINHVFLLNMKTALTLKDKSNQIGWGKLIGRKEFSRIDQVKSEFPFLFRQQI